jgi:biotin carboxyl carrier protein
MNHVAGVQTDLVVSLDELRQFSGTPREFWPKFIELVQRLTRAAEAYFYVGHAEPEAGWQEIVCLPNSVGDTSPTPRAGREKLASRAASEGGVIVGRGSDIVWLATGFRVEGDTQVGAVLIRLDSTEPGWIAEARLRLGLVAHTPNIYQSGRALRQMQEDSAHAKNALDLLLLVNDQEKFLGAAMVLCNELATRFRCERVSLGWFDGRYTRLKAVSHMERFERRMDAITRIEAAMDEAVDQDEEVVYPAPEGSLAITRDHASYAGSEKIAHLLTLPLRVDQKPVAAITLERDTEGFSDHEVRGLRVLCDQSSRRLAERYAADQWIGKRVWRRVRAAAGRFLQPQHTGRKLAGLTAAVIVGVLVFGRWPYKVEAPFLLRTDKLLHVSAPFDGYIEEVMVKPGDKVSAGRTLLKLDGRQLAIDQAAARADLQRFESEAEKARSEENAADMRVAEAQAAQARASLELTRHRLSQTEVKASFDGVVVEGDLQERIGAPVKQGEQLFRVARLDGLYAELKVPERAVHEIRERGEGHIAFVSRPDLRFAFKVERIEPAAVAEEGGNVFLVRCVFAESPAKWWRPGMSGLAKIEVEPRPVWWVLSHRAIDFLRMKLWW